jgi:hypothetical protein
MGIDGNSPRAMCAASGAPASTMVRIATDSGFVSKLLRKHGRLGSEAHTDCINIVRWHMGTDQSLLTVLAALAGGLGLGSIVTTLIQQVFLRRSKAEDTRLSMRRDAFADLLAAISKLDRLGGDSSAEPEAEYALCVARVELVASKAVLMPLKAWRDFEADTPERIDCMASLLREMRRDLGIAKDAS